MFGNVTDLPSLRSYDEALEHYNSITPIRGSNNLRPICATHNGRRKKHMQIVKTTYPKALGAAATPKGALDAVACRLYDTDVVTFVENGDIVLDNGGYPSTTTHSFIDGIFTGRYYYSPVYAYAKGERTVIEVGKRLMLMDDYSTPIVLRYTDGVLDFSPEMVTQKGYYLKRSVMNAKRKEVHKFRKFILACAMMVDPSQYRVSRRGVEALHAEELYQAIVDEDQWGDAFEYLLTCSINSSYDYYNHRRDLSVNKSKLNSMVDDVLKYVFAEELFEARETNNPLSNDNAKYLQGAQEKIV